MNRKKEVSLQMESFHRGEDAEFQIRSRREMQFILQDVADKGTRVVLYYDGPREFILTTILGASEQGVWLDVSPHAPENKRILHSDSLTVVSLHQGVKLQFVVDEIQSALVGDDDAFFLPLPDYLLRIQRRDYFRLGIPISTPLKCIVPVRPYNPDEPDQPAITRELPILDISGGGLSLRGEEHEQELSSGRSFSGCRFTLPNIGILTVTLVIRSQSSLTNSDDTVSKRIGCQFVHLDNQTNLLLQQYINRLQSEALVQIKS